MYNVCCGMVKSQNMNHKVGIITIIKGNLMTDDEYILRINVPLMLRLLEFAREDSHSDLDLHFLTENLIKHNGLHNYLSMKQYNELVEKVNG